MLSFDPILLNDGSGVVGRWTARFLRAAYPNLPLLIGGLDLVKAEKAASEIGNAEGVVLKPRRRRSWPGGASG